MIKRLLAVGGMVFGVLVAVMAYPILAVKTGVVTVGQHLDGPAAGLIAWTYAQTVTLSEMGTETSSLVTTNVPSLAVFIAFLVIVGGAGFLVGRFLRAGKA